MPASDVTIVSPPNVPPLWETRSAELLCPLCKYNLRGLTEARCPECGFAFEWQELLDAEKNRHQYIFEHGRGQNFSSFWRTYWRTCWPRTFWTVLNPAQPVKLFRLLVYWMVGAGLVAVCLSPSRINDLVLAARENISERATMHPVPNQPGMVAFPWGQMPLSQVDSIWPLPWQFQFWLKSWRFPIKSQVAFGWAQVFIAWPWVTLLALMIFRFSMRQAKIRTVHLLRTVIYSGDFGFLLGICFLVVHFSDPKVATGWQILIGVILCSLVTGYRLTIAFRDYLRVHLPFRTVFASQVIALLFMFLILTLIADFSRRV